MQLYLSNLKKNFLSTQSIERNIHQSTLRMVGSTPVLTNRKDIITTVKKKVCNFYRKNLFVVNVLYLTTFGESFTVKYCEMYGFERKTITI